MNTRPYSDELTHYGVKGMKWGVRRYRNKDGSYTSAGRKRYSKLSISDVDEQVQRQYGTSKLRDIGSAAGTGISLLGSTVGMLTGNPALGMGSAYLGSTIASGTSIASIAKYYRDGHRYIHKYD